MPTPFPRSGQADQSPPLLNRYARLLQQPRPAADGVPVVLPDALGQNGPGDEAVVRL